jgi:bis(5'-nucleosidyl)-tetraphosphatase
MSKLALSAGIVIVRREEHDWKYLFLRAYRNWDFPKGMVETGEDPLETAKRESEEEAGISDLNFNWGHVFKETEPYTGPFNRKKKIARYYIAETAQVEVTFSINPEIGRPEHHEYRWLIFEELEKLSPERLLPIIEWANSLILRQKN